MNRNLDRRALSDQPPFRTLCRRVRSGLVPGVFAVFVFGEPELQPPPQHPRMREGLEAGMYAGAFVQDLEWSWLMWAVWRAAGPTEALRFRLL